MRRFEETTNPRQQPRRKMPKSWLVKFRSPSGRRRTKIAGRRGLRTFVIPRSHIPRSFESKFGKRCAKALDGARKNTLYV